MALMKKLGAVRRFLVQPDLTAPAYLEFGDATPEDVAAYHAEVLKVQATNQGAMLDDEHRKKTAEVLFKFTLARITRAVGFGVEDADDKGGKVARDLSWPEDKDRILAFIAPGQKKIFSDLVAVLNALFPTTAQAFTNAALQGSWEPPNS